MSGGRNKTFLAEGKQNMMSFITNYNYEKM